MNQDPGNRIDNADATRRYNRKGSAGTRADWLDGRSGWQRL